MSLKERRAATLNKTGKSPELPLPLPHPGALEDHMLFGISCTTQEYNYLEALVSSREEAYKGVHDFRMLPNPDHAIKKEPEVSSSVEATLAQRGSRYGDFTDHARICQDLKEVMYNARINMPDLTTSEEHHLERSWPKLSPVQKQALEVIADKIARILSGDPNYDDNWHDIQGYAKLVEDRLPCNQVKEA